MKKKNKLVKKTEDKALAVRPDWVPEVENVGNAMMAAGQEFLLVVDDVLIRYFDFTEKDIKKLHDKINPILRGVQEYEKHGLSMLSPHSVRTVGDLVEEKGITEILGEIAKIRHTKEKFQQAGMEYPILEGAKPFLSKLKEKNAD